MNASGITVPAAAGGNTTAATEKAAASGEGAPTGVAEDCKRKTSVSMRALMSLIAEMVEQNGKLKAALMKQSIETSVMLKDMKVHLAAKVAKDGQLQCALKMAGAGMQFAMSGVCTAKMGAPKILKDKHVSIPGKDAAGKPISKPGKVADLSEQDFKKQTSDLNDKRVRKYQMLGQFSTPMREAWNNSTEAVIVTENTKEQKEIEASVELSQELSRAQEKFIDNLQGSHQKFLEAMDAAARAAMPGGR